MTKKEKEILLNAYMEKAVAYYGMKRLMGDDKSADSAISDLFSQMTALEGLAHDLGQPLIGKRQEAERRSAYWRFSA